MVASGLVTSGTGWGPLNRILNPRVPRDAEQSLVVESPSSSGCRKPNGKRKGEGGTQGGVEA
jgi:hypothetical protein